MLEATSGKVGQPQVDDVGLAGEFGVELSEFVFRVGEADLESLDSPSRPSRSASAMRARRLSRIASSGAAGSGRSMELRTQA